MNREDRIKALTENVKKRIVILDGGMGTMIQLEGLSEEQFRGERFSDWPKDLKGNNDLLNLTQPDVIRRLHMEYGEAGADVLETNTFSSTRLAQADYGMEDLAAEMNLEGARLAREAADALTEQQPDKPRFVAGALGPTNKTASLSPDVNRPGYRAVSFDGLRENYAESARALIEGGADLLLVETIFDTLNAKAALFAIEEVFDELGVKLPLIISGTITDASGRNLSGQTAEAFYNSIRHADPMFVGLNCALGPAQMRPFIAELARTSETYVSAYPNAGLPNEMGEYDETPEMTSGHLREWAKSGLVNLVGGCCGTTPEHIRAIAEAMEGLPPRQLPERPIKTRLSGLEPLNLSA